MKTERRLRLFIVARIVVTLLFLVSVLVLKVQDPEAIENTAFRGIVLLMASSCFFSAASLAALRRKRWQLSLTYLQIFWDLLFVTLLLLFTDGIASPYSFLYLLAIMNAALLLSRREALYTAALSGILFGAMVDLQYYGLLDKVGLSPLSALQRGSVVIFYTIFLHLTGFIVTAFITGYLTERARSSEDALRVSQVNYEELQRLHSSIVQHLTNGLMTVTRDGSIRVFNPYLERLTGISQEDAYDKACHIIFPHVPWGEQSLSQPQQGEFCYRTASVEPLIIGYRTMPFCDVLGEPAGMIVTIRNLTDSKQLELALKRQDRLAALGELAARMAHEIRNPLAAISGSVQLLAVNGCLQEHESKLLAIVLRESDRLNGLITDFLAYARPAAPRFERFELINLADDLLTLLAADARFEQICLNAEVPAGIELFADRAQLHQTLLNLLQNGAESMPGGGELTLSAAVQEGRDDAGHVFSLVRLMVADRGSGLDDETSRHLFEPFWTTKPAGTGLGLATVYRIVEAHGGTIQAQPREGGGTVFTILLPIVEGIA
ncbi:MAG: ATP-binding protein [Trichlorobacter sp.]